ncbi:MAG TPA: hydrogenase maturation protease [Thermoplasmata archaeon]|jgi:hydrogenase maturation protease|nr:hydrogenase maturation protease [Thermoplasmata archaeon]
MKGDAEEGNRILVVGVGNPILSDDGIGIHVARALKERNPGVSAEELPASGLELLDMVLGFDTVVIVDAIETRGGTPGEIHILDESDFERAVHGSSPHGINIATALALGRKVAPDKMPERVVYVAVEAEDLLTVSESLTEKVAEALPKVVEMIERDFLSRS